VQRLAAHIEGGDPRRCADDDLAVKRPDDGAQQRRFAGPSPAGDKEIAVGLLDEFEGRKKIRCRLDARRPKSTVLNICLVRQG